MRLDLIDTIIWVRKLKTASVPRRYRTDYPSPYASYTEVCKRRFSFQHLACVHFPPRLMDMFCHFFCSWPCFCPYSYRTNVQVGCQWATPGCIDWQLRQVCIRSNSGVQWYLILSVSSPPLLLPKTALQSANCTLSDIQLFYIRYLYGVYWMLRPHCTICTKYIYSLNPSI